MERVYEIAYVNDIPVDTTSAPGDVILDVKALVSGGRYMYQVDLTGFAEPGEMLYGGLGGYGSFELDIENNMLYEYQEWGTGITSATFDPKSKQTITRNNILQ